MLSKSAIRESIKNRLPLPGDKMFRVSIERVGGGYTSIMIQADSDLQARVRCRIAYPRSSIISVEDMS